MSSLVRLGLVREIYGGGVYLLPVTLAGPRVVRLGHAWFGRRMGSYVGEWGTRLSLESQGLGIVDEIRVQVGAYDTVGIHWIRRISARLIREIVSRETPGCSGGVPVGLCENWMLVHGDLKGET